MCAFLFACSFRSLLLMNMKQRMPKRMPPNQCPPLISLLVSRLYFCGMFFECSLVTATMYRLICMYVLLSYMYVWNPTMGACGRPQFWFLEKILLDCEIWRKKFLRICYFSSTTLSICGMKSGQAFPFIDLKSWLKNVQCSSLAPMKPPPCLNPVFVFHSVCALCPSFWNVMHVRMRFSL